MDDFFTGLIGRTTGSSPLVQPVVLPMFASMPETKGMFYQCEDQSNAGMTSSIPPESLMAGIRASEYLGNEGLNQDGIPRSQAKEEKPPSNSIPNGHEDARQYVSWGFKKAKILDQPNPIVSPEEIGKERTFLGIPIGQGNRESIYPSIRDPGGERNDNKRGMQLPESAGSRESSGVPVSSAGIPPLHSWENRLSPEPFGSTKRDGPGVSLRMNDGESQPRNETDKGHEGFTRERTIRVTIGRVEVRAVMQPTLKPPLREMPKSRLSLEDYLRQGRAGRR